MTSFTLSWCKASAFSSNAFRSSVYHPSLDLREPRGFLVVCLVFFFSFLEYAFFCSVLTFGFCCVAHFMACCGLSGARGGLDNNVLKRNEWLVHNWRFCVPQEIISLSGCSGGPLYMSSG